MNSDFKVCRLPLYINSADVSKSAKRYANNVNSVHLINAMIHILMTTTTTMAVAITNTTVYDDNVDDDDTNNFRVLYWHSCIHSKIEHESYDQERLPVIFLVGKFEFQLLDECTERKQRKAHLAINNNRVTLRVNGNKCICYDRWYGSFVYFVRGFCLENSIIHVWLSLMCVRMLKLSPARIVPSFDNQEMSKCFRKRSRESS